MAMAEVTAIGLYFQLWFSQVPQWLLGLGTPLCFQRCYHKFSLCMGYHHFGTPKIYSAAATIKDF